MTISNPTEKTFFNLGIAPKILEILEGLKFSVPTPIQSQAIPHALAGKDIMGIAQTGTGKTLAFGIPLIQSLAKSKGVGLIILPTRELAVQVEDALNNLGRHLGMKTAVLIGGENINRQIQPDHQPGGGSEQNQSALTRNCSTHNISSRI
jgi:superfamily II DNA/RNA helicase